jgi:nucleoside-diphosphate-sugar epimerase
MKNKVLIIGGCGYIGSSLFNFLQNKGLDVDTVDLEWFGNYSVHKNINIDYRSLTKEFLSKYQSIVLLAAHSSVKMCENSMLPAFKNNVVNFVELINKIDKQRLIYASSSSVYGVVDTACDETHDVYKPISVYDTTKQEIDNYALLSKKNYYGLRFGTVNGASPNLRVDIMINAMVNSAMTNGHINLINAETRRPILYINDLCRAVFEIVVSKEDNPGIYNLSSFNSTSGEIANRVAEILKVPIHDLGKSKVVYDFLINNAKFCKTYGFKFEGNVEKIVYNLYSNIENCEKTHRNNEVNYL